ncbi:unnamed protein product, partial [Ectocarpus sp. 12 AP-2014]
GGHAAREATAVPGTRQRAPTRLLGGSLEYFNGLETVVAPGTEGRRPKRLLEDISNSCSGPEATDVRGMRKPAKQRVGTDGHAITPRRGDILKHFNGRGATDASGTRQHPLTRPLGDMLKCFNGPGTTDA